MSSSPSSASLRFNTFASLSNREKSQKQTKPPDLATMKASIATPNPCTTSILLDVDHGRIGGKFMGCHRRKQATAPPLIRDSASTTPVKHQIEVEAHTLSDLRTACTTVTRWTIARKIAPSTLSQKIRWIKT
jgi:hypothetical protein